MNQKLRCVTLIFFVMLCFSCMYANEKYNITDTLDISESVDTIAYDRQIALPLDSVLAADSIAFSQKPWVKQLFETGFMLHDPRINYPKFARFLLKVYDWGDKTFNSYEPDYVEQTGKNWKATFKSHNWMESYMMLFPEKLGDILQINSEVYADAGAYINFMAVSVGYTAKISDIFGGKKNNRTNFNFNFTCSRFFANLDITSTKGNTRIIRFGDYKGDLTPYDFNGVTHKMTSAEAFYIFNFSQYSQAAAYCYSKYQLKSAGSWLLGATYSHQNIKFDFSELPEEMKQHLPNLDMNYHYRYSDYGICGGYAYNWAIAPRKWLVNITLYPALGYRWNEYDRGRLNMLAISGHGKFAIVYNHKALFASFSGRFDGNVYLKRRYCFVNSIESLSLVVGARF